MCIARCSLRQASVNDISQAYPDLTPEEQQVLLNIRKRKEELLNEIYQLKEELSDVNTEIEAMDTEELAAELEKHEAICAERWKTVFNQLEGIEERSGKRFDGVESSITRIETILISVAGTIIVAGASMIITMLSMH